jgi:glycerol-3-phosphate dehydrogenase
MTIALAENAVANGVELRLMSEVVAIERVADHFLVQTRQGVLEARYVINAAGLYSDRVAAMVGADHFEILPRRGQYILFHKSQAHLTDRVLFQTPTDKGKGVLVTTTYHGNLMIGPDAEDTGDPEDLDTTEERLKWIITEARRSIPDFDLRSAITTFSGVRARPDGGDFIIEMSSVPGFVNVAGIESPGFTSAPAIARRVVEILAEGGLKLTEKADFDPNRPAIIRPKGPDFDGTTKEAPPEKHIICRCEKVTEAEILDALDRPLPVLSLDAVKRRTRAGMGACQASFCADRVRALLARELDVPAESITKRGEGSTPPPVRVPIQTIRKFDL